MLVNCSSDSQVLEWCCITNLHLFTVPYYVNERVVRCMFMNRWNSQTVFNSPRMETGLLLKQLMCGCLKFVLGFRHFAGHGAVGGF